MNKSMLITRPDHDDVTTYLHAWGRKIIETANKKDMKVYDLSRDKANRIHFISVASNKNPKFIVFNGHGDERTITGYDNQVLISCDQNLHLLKSKIVYSVSCKSAKELGRECIKQGTLAFLGYDEDFIFYYNPNEISKPLNDNVATPCLDSTTQFAMSIIKGNTSEHSYNNSQEKYRKWIRKFIRSRELDAPYILQALIENMTNQRLLGDKTCSL